VGYNRGIIYPESLIEVADPSYLRINARGGAYNFEELYWGMQQTDTAPLGFSYYFWASSITSSSITLRMDNNKKVYQ
jgi:hypothetical protein